MKLAPATRGTTPPGLHTNCFPPPTGFLTRHAVIESNRAPFLAGATSLGAPVPAPPEQRVTRIDGCGVPARRTPMVAYSNYSPRTPGDFFPSHR